MELHNTMVTLALCLLLQPFAWAGGRDPRLDHHKHRRAQKSSSPSTTTTTTPKPADNRRKPDVQQHLQYKNNEIKYDPIEVQYQTQQYPNLLGGRDEKPAHQSPLITQHLQQQQVNLQQVHVQQPMLQLPSATPQLHPYHQQQIIQMIQRALYATQRHNQPTAMIIIAQPSSNRPQRQPPRAPAFDGQFAGQTQSLLNYYQQQQPQQQDNNQQDKYQLLQESTPQQIHQYIAEPNHPPQNYQILPAPAFHYQPNLAYPTPMPTTHMSPVQPAQAYPHHLSQLTNLAQLYSSPAQQYASSSQQYISPAQQEYLTPAQAYPRHAHEYLGAAHQFQFGAEQSQLGGAEQGGVPVRSLPPIITGFENFSPEQQEKIKEQLSAHFGAPLKLLPGKENGGGEYQVFGNEPFVPSPEFGGGRSARGSSSIMSLTKNMAQKM